MGGNDGAIYRSKRLRYDDGYTALLLRTRDWSDAGHYTTCRQTQAELHFFVQQYVTSTGTRKM